MFRQQAMRLNFQAAGRHAVLLYGSGWRSTKRTGLFSFTPTI
jgi:hypothetical protein